jgi:hypothetical protein
MLINCVVCQQGRKLLDIPVDAIDDDVSRPDCFVWVALRDAQHEFGLHEQPSRTLATANSVRRSMVMIEETETTQRLAAWAGILAVATAFAGIWGMNFEHTPELSWTFGHPAALGLIASACGLPFWRIKQAGWL